ncbi:MULTISPECIES: hypothetical protein [unclassified Lactobacillus]|nr:MULTISPECIES: hypothetical protein [unclassified Lactobacillus]RMC24158.1 hypothetical protein F5ESL0247_05335 [Lactobacillus sp. ESL0247]RMC28731.1 hypothetical protein F5ESL0246_05335 [Lactobacillus sp. ESL0246]RMC31388.1 hypothetical protein F5ESL0245_05340 [Lactobacillus sp. ESL0245]
MKTKRFSYRFILIGLLITFIGFWGGQFLIRRSDPSTMELLNTYLNANLVSLYLQPIILTLFYSQVLALRKIRLFVGVRKKNNQIIAFLLGIATFYCLIFLLSLFVPYLGTNYPFFKNGSPVLGMTLLLLHVFVLLFLSWLLVGGYQLHHPYFLLFLVIVLDLIYHFIIEKKLLILYSPLYDPLYRAVHHIYGGY